MNEAVIERLGLIEVPGYFFGETFIHNIKTYKLPGDRNIYCAKALPSGKPSDNVMLWEEHTGPARFTMVTEEFLLNYQGNPGKAIVDLIMDFL